MTCLRCPERGRRGDRSAPNKEALMAGSIAATTRLVGAGDRIDLCWRDDVFAISHVGGEGSAWTRARIGAVGSVTPESPDALGGTFTTVPAAAWTFAQRRFVAPTVPPPIHQGPVRTPAPAPRGGLRDCGEAVGAAPEAVPGGRSARTGFGLMLCRFVSMPSEGGPS
jgi:hypothetical protein